jgi:hypothetical protein
MTNPSVRELLIQVPCHLSTEMQDAHHAGSTYVVMFFSFRLSSVSVHSFVTVEKQTYVHIRSEIKSCSSDSH